MEGVRWILDVREDLASQQLYVVVCSVGHEVITLVSYNPPFLSLNNATCGHWGPCTYGSAPVAARIGFVYIEAVPLG